jgi:hypothetical protein
VSRQPRHREHHGPLPRQFFPCFCTRILVEAVGCQLNQCPSCGSEPVRITARNDRDALDQRARILNARQAA